MSVKIKDYFNCVYGSNLEFNIMEEIENGIPFVSRTEKNNGVCGFVEEILNIEPNPANTISVAVSGTILESFLQKEPYYTGYHVMILKPKQEFTDNELLFYCMCIKANAYKYSFGRQANKTLKDIVIPSKNEIPKYVYENTKSLQRDPYINKEIELNINSWKEFCINDTFNFKRGKRITKLFASKNEGEIPVIGGGAENHGVLCYLDEKLKDKYVFQKKCFTVSAYGSAGSVIYHDYNCFIDDKALSFTFKNDHSIYISIFFEVLLNLEKSKYAYGRGVIESRYKETIIKLPINSKGEPDFEFMENYIKSLPYSKNLE
jgi:hypothetical protein